MNKKRNKDVFQKRQAIDNAFQGIQLSDGDKLYLARLCDKNIDEVQCICNIILKVRIQNL